MVEIKNLKVLDKGYVKLIDIMGNEDRITNIACISYGKEKSSNKKKLLKKLLTSKHYSPFEQIQFTFKIKAPIFIARQWMRHRTGKYNEQSRRYTKKNWEYYVPSLDRLQNNDKIQKRIISMYEYQKTEYEDLINDGIVPEVARGIMGIGFYTTFYFTVDLRNLLHFLELRKDNHAQFEIQEYANAIETLVEQDFPTVMDYWKKINGFN